MTRRPSKLSARGPDAPDAGPVQAPDVSEARQTLPAVVASPAAVEGADVLLCLAHLLGLMPVGVALECRQGGRGFVITTIEAVHKQCVASGVPVFVGRELSRIATAAAADRLVFAPQMLARWLEHKAADPRFIVDWAEAMGGAVVPDRVDRWTIGQVFDLLGVELVSVRMEERPA